MKFILLNIIVVVLCVCAYRIVAKQHGLGKSTIKKRISQIKEVHDRVKYETKKRESTSKFLANSYSWVNSLKLFNISDKKLDNMNYLALRLHMVVNGVNLSGTDLYTIRSLFMIIYIGAVLLSSLMNFKFLPLVCFYPMVGTIIDEHWRRSVKSKDEMIEKDFFDFFSEFYFTYKFPDNIREHVEDVAMRFYIRANKETQHMINLFRADAKISEEYALDNLKKNFHIVNIARMCDQIKLIISGKPIGVDGLNAFKEELNSARKFIRQQENNVRKEKAEKIMVVPIILIMIVIVGWVIVLLGGAT